MRKVRPSLEALETRTLPAAQVVASLAAGVLTIEGTPGADRIALWQGQNQLAVLGVNIAVNGKPVTSVASGSVQKIVVNALGGDDVVLLNQDKYGSQRVTQPALIDGGDGNDYLAAGWGNSTLKGGAGNDSLYGGAGKDSVSGGDGNDLLYGGAGVDLLYGDAGNDALHGGDDNDFLSGGDGNDQLFGEGGYDSLRGGNGDDVLDAGTRGEDVDGGAGWDLDVYRWAVAGVKATDVMQQQAPTCAFLAALQTVAQTDPNALANGITYLGSYKYQVRLFRDGAGGAAGQWVTQTVYFDGNVTPLDCQQAAEGNFWTLLYQRAWEQERKFLGVSDIAYPSEAFLALTGKAGGWGWATDLAGFQQLLKLPGVRLIVATKPDLKSISPKLVENHAYAVVGLDAGGNLVLRNPWGYDGGAQASGTATDGLVTLTWAEYSKSVLTFWVN